MINRVAIVKKKSRSRSEIKRNKHLCVLNKGINFFKHQKETLFTLMEDPQDPKLVILPTGTGKTLISLTFANKLNQLSKVKTIIVSENNLITQLEEDYQKFYTYTKNLTTTKKDPPAKRHRIYKTLIEKETDILALNYHSISNDLGQIEMVLLRLRLRGYKILIVLDEAENVGGETSKISKSVKYLVQKYSNYKIGMTASPLKNDLDKTQTILEVLDFPNLPDRDTFYKNYCNIDLESVLSLNINNRRTGYPIRAKNPLYEDEAQFIFKLWSFIPKKLLMTPGNIRVINTSSKCDVEILNANTKEVSVYIPNGYEGGLSFVLQFGSINVQVSGYVSVRKKVNGFKNIKNYYSSISDNLISYSKRDIGTIPPFRLHKKILKIDGVTKTALKEVYNEYKEVPYAVETIATITPELDLYERELLDELSKKPKTSVLCAIFKQISHILERGEQVIIFTKYTSVAEVINYYLEKLNISYHYIHGSLTGKNAITNIKEDFNAGIVSTLVMTESGLRGLNLQVCNNIICSDLPVSAGDFLQLAGRISRLGVKHSRLNMYLYIIKNTVLEDLYNLIFGQLALIREFDSNLLEDGLFDEEVTSISLNVKTDTYIRQGLKRRQKLYK